MKPHEWGTLASGDGKAVRATFLASMIQSAYSH
jgi:hypothetical protein